MDRRGFLRLAGLAGTTAALTACSTTGTPVTAPTSPASGSSVPSGPPDWAALRARLSGRLVLAGEDGFSYQGFNPVRDGSKPAAIARCTSAADVQACVEIAGRRAPLAARSGGHSYAGYSSPEGGLQIDLRGLSEVEVLGDQVRIGAGAALGDVARTLVASGRCLPTGTCPSVGVAGLTLGGGIGVLARKHGLTCDHLVQAAVVLADGRTVTASASQEPDLFWALRGGGGGNFGIVTEFVFSTVPAPQVTVFSLQYPAGAAADVLGAWQGWIAQVPRELWSNAVVRGGAVPSCRVGGCLVGSVGELAALLDGLPAAQSRFIQPKSYAEATQYFAGGPIERESFVASSRIVREPIGDPAKAVGLLAGQSDETYLIFDGLRGAVSDVAPDATAFPHRGALACAQIYLKTPPEAAEQATRALGQIRDGLGALVGETGYVNYIDPQLPNWAQAYYGGNLARLRQVAAKYDPDQVFGFAQAVSR